MFWLGWLEWDENFSSESIDEQEFQQVISLKCDGVNPRDNFVPVLADYERITGLKETNPNASTITGSCCTASMPLMRETVKNTESKTPWELHGSCSLRGMLTSSKTGRNCEVLTPSFRRGIS